MNSGPSGDPKEISGVLRRVNWLGSATEQMFSRLYAGLRRRSRLEQEEARIKRQRALLDARSEQVDRVRDHNRKLKEMLEERDAEIERFQGILSALDQGIIMQDLEGRIVMMNEAARDLLGGQRNFWESDLASLSNSYRTVETDSSDLVPLGEATKIQVNNRIVGAQFAAISDSKGMRLGTLIMLRDVTQDAVIERLKDSFVTHISHELKTPMTVIKLAGEVLSSQPEDQPANRRMLEALTRNIDILDRMVVELLDISEMNAGTFAIRSDYVSIEEVIWSVINGLGPEIKRARLDVQVMTRDIDRLFVRGDAQRLQWAVGHVVRNGVLYTEPGGQIIIAARLMEREDRTEVVISVMDTGVGINDKDLPHIFDRFYRGEARNADGRLLDPRGLGQGLFVARTITDAHSGYLTVQTQVGRGSVFVFNLPLAEDLPQIA